MPVMTLHGAIVQSLKEHEMDADLPKALLSRNRTEVLRHDETDYWDYKEQLKLDNQLEVARIAKDILGFHNGKGGVIIVGVDDDYHAVGVPESQVLDTNVLHGKLRKYTGYSFSLFQDTISVPNGKVLWLIFIPRRQASPIAVASNGPQDEKGRPYIRRDEYYVRVNDETKLCIEPADYERLFTNVSMDHIQAYLYDIDEPYFRLLAPHCAQFVGRKQLLSEVHEALDTRHPVVSLDGVGGVGKSAIALELVRHLYDAKKYMFIVSQSAKTRVWHDYVGSRKAGFSGLTEFLKEIAKAMQLPTDGDLEDLKSLVVDALDGLEGLLLVDNIEDIQDPAVFHFLSREVPGPVKVLVTSRIDRGIGALTISIPEMNELEARELLLHELDRLGYKGFYGEESYVQEVLHVTGRLPLALKWAAGLAVSLGSLKDASSRFRKQDGTKREFLNFCFATMYDVLTPLARDVALLCPYLGEEWNVTSASVALDKPEIDISKAIDELKDKGIVLASSSTREGALSLLPLTVDFLSSKWHENEVLRRQVTHRLADAIATTDIEGILLNWPREQRVQVLQQRAEALRANGDLKRAKQLVRLALNWSSNPRLRFLEGRILYESGKKSDGLSYMHVALAQAQAQEAMSMTDERLTLAQALLSSGGSRDAREALRLFQTAIPQSTALKRNSVESYCKLALELREYTSIADLIGRMENPIHLHWMVESLRPLIHDRMLIAACGKSLVHAFRAAAKSSEITDKEREECSQEAARIEASLK